MFLYQDAASLARVLDHYAYVQGHYGDGHTPLALAESSIFDELRYPRGGPADALIIGDAVEAAYDQLYSQLASTQLGVSVLAAVDDYNAHRFKYQEPTVVLLPENIDTKLRRYLPTPVEQPLILSAQLKLLISKVAACERVKYERDGLEAAPHGHEIGDCVDIGPPRTYLAAGRTWDPTHSYDGMVMWREHVQAAGQGLAAQGVALRVDGNMFGASFNSTRDAIAAAVMLQHLSVRMLSAASPPIAVAMAVHTAKPNAGIAEPYSVVEKLAVRLVEHAAPGEILCPAVVYRDADDSDQMDYLIYDRGVVAVPGFGPLARSTSDARIFEIKW